MLFVIVLSVPTISPLVLAENKSLEDILQRCEKRQEEDVVYIISSTEKDVFLQLETNWEREQFIEAFWKHRDLTTDTSENEFKTEHYRRINYANYTFGRDVPKPGWKTDRERI